LPINWQLTWQTIHLRLGRRHHPHAVTACNVRSKPRLRRNYEK
jgi:hypothetical protein